MRELVAETFDSFRFKFECHLIISLASRGLLVWDTEGNEDSWVSRFPSDSGSLSEWWQNLK